MPKKPLSLVEKARREEEEAWLKYRKAMGLAVGEKTKARNDALDATEKRVALEGG